MASKRLNKVKEALAHSLKHGTGQDFQQHDHHHLDADLHPPQQKYHVMLNKPLRSTVGALHRRHK